MLVSLQMLSKEPAKSRLAVESRAGPSPSMLCAISGASGSSGGLISVDHGAADCTRRHELWAEVKTRGKEDGIDR
jgi:hypothetical protein